MLNFATLLPFSDHIAETQKDFLHIIKVQEQVCMLQNSHLFT